MPFIDPANPGPWLASLSASRRRRAEAARLARRKRAGRGGGAALLAAMTLAAGGAVAQDGPATTKTATTGSTVVAVQRALGVSADGVIGPITRRAIRNYQRNHGLAVDGIAGPATRATLQRALAAKRAAGVTIGAGGAGATAGGIDAGSNPVTGAPTAGDVIFTAIGWAAVAMVLVGLGFAAWQYRGAIGLRLKLLLRRKTP